MEELNLDLTKGSHLALPVRKLAHTAEPFRA
jgi:hypothetical protein